MMVAKYVSIFALQFAGGQTPGNLGMPEGNMHGTRKLKANR